VSLDEDGPLGLVGLERDIQLLEELAHVGRVVDVLQATGREVAAELAAGFDDGGLVAAECVGPRSPAMPPPRMRTFMLLLPGGWRRGCA